MSKKILYVYNEPVFHPAGWAGHVLSNILKADGRFNLETTADLDAFKSLPQGDYAAVVVYTTGLVNDLTEEREKGLISFVKNGGGFVGIHSAADSFRGSRSYVEMLNGEFLFHPERHTFDLSVKDKTHYITSRMADFSLFDEMYHLQNHDPSKVRLLMTTVWQGKEIPMLFERKHGKGRVVYVANGHTKEAWNQPEFQKIVLRSIAFSTGENLAKRKINCGIAGYGPTFNMGRHHSEWIDSIEGLKTVAMCDIDTERVKAARKELPRLKGYFNCLEDMLKMDELDLVVNIVPHNIHSSMAIKCLEAGKHAVVEKPFCLNVREADGMIFLAREKKLMLSVFHNRRWDPDYLAIKDIVGKGLIGRIVHIECGLTGYNHPRFWWRSDKNIGGGILFDWGAHFMDWVLNLVNSKVVQVMGYLKKVEWKAVTAEDYGQILLRFENGVTVDYVSSCVSSSVRPKWRILGTKGSIEVSLSNEVILISMVSGIRQESVIKLSGKNDAWAQYYRNIADHLIMGEELTVKPEQAKRVIGIIESAEKSAKEGRSIAPVEGCE
ncbi:MAG TPA: ThuA domain-containing protein [bacterium]|nr:ThuA domain-containing protein [bacterium]